MAIVVTGPSGLASRTRLLCKCGQWVTVYAMGDDLWFPGRTAIDGNLVTLICKQCGRTGIVDLVKLRHAVAEQRRTFRIP
jgi:hypothetical protein